MRDPGELSAHACLTFRVQTAVRLWCAGSGIWRLRDSAGDYEVAVSGSVVSNNADTLVSAAIGGLGWVLVVFASWQVADELAQGRLVPMLTDYEVRPSAAESAIYAVYPSARHLSSKVRVFIDFLAERYRRSPVFPWGKVVADELR